MSLWKLTLLCVSLRALELYASQSIPKEEIMQEVTPNYLYKVLSFEAWKESQEKSRLILPSTDDAFIHFSKEDQLASVISKYWNQEASYVILKIDPNKLSGNLVYETNPGGVAQYYHLYNGFIPLESVVESELVTQEVTRSSFEKTL